MHVAVDLDDVVLDFMNSVRETFHREYGVWFEYDGNSWGEKAVDFYKHPLLLESGYKSWWDWLRDREWLWATFPAIPGAIGGIKRIRNAGHYVEAVTSKPTWAEHNVWKWLGRWRPPFNSVTIVNSGQSKVDYTVADIIIDDKLQTCMEFVQDGRKAIHFQRTSEFHHQPSASLFVATDWQEVVRIINTHTT